MNGGFINAVFNSLVSRSRRYEGDEESKPKAPPQMVAASPAGIAWRGFFAPSERRRRHGRAQNITKTAHFFGRFFLCFSANFLRSNFGGQI